MVDSLGNWTLDDLKKIKSAIASGASKVEYNDRTVTYKTSKALQEAKNQIEIELGLKKRGGRIKCRASKGIC